MLSSSGQVNERRVSPELISILAVGVALAGLVLTGLRGVRTEMQAVRVEMNTVRNEMNTLRTELRTEMQALRSEINEVRAEMADLRERVARLEGMFEGFIKRPPLGEPGSG